MATKTWTGAISTDWHNAGNWSGGAPTSADDVVLAGANPCNIGDNFSSNGECKTLTSAAYTGLFSCIDGTNLRAYGSVSFGAGMTLNSAFEIYFMVSGTLTTNGQTLGAIGTDANNVTVTLGSNVTTNRFSTSNGSGHVTTFALGARTLTFENAFVFPNQTCIFTWADGGKILVKTVAGGGGGMDFGNNGATMTWPRIELDATAGNSIEITSNMTVQRWTVLGGVVDLNGFTITELDPAGGGGGSNIFWAL